MDIRKQIEESIEVKKGILDMDNIIREVEDVIRALIACYQNGNKLLIAGNGGSAADAQHFAGEIIGRFKKERRGYPAIALTTDSSVLTAWANDYDFDTVFSRQVEALGQKGDIFFGISTSGNSKNIIECVKKAKNMGLKTICLLGKNGGVLSGLSDIGIVVPSDSTARTQESHIMLIHIISEEIEKTFK